MNAKKAKALRRIARQETIGLPGIEYKQETVKRKSADGTVYVVLGTRTLAPCTRKFYKELKKRFK